MKSRRSLLWHYYPYLLLIIVCSLVILALYTSSLLKKSYLDSTTQNLYARSQLMGKLIFNQVTTEDFKAVQALCDSLGHELSYRITVILPSGEVVGDSEEDPNGMDNHHDRLEIKNALNNEIGVSTRYSYTLNEKMLYVAVPIKNQDQIVFIVRSSLPITFLSNTLTAIYRRITLIGSFIVLGTAVMTWLFSRQIKKPIEELEKGVLHFGNGDLDYRIYIPKPEEFNILSTAMNKMAAQLNEELHKITNQKKELESILSSMIEGLLVIDKDEKITRLNQAARDILNLKAEETHQRTIQEVIRNTELLQFIQTILSKGKKGEKELSLHEKEGIDLRVYGTIFEDEDHRTIGALIVLNDITRLKQLEKIRREFVDNVSHELKTPITAIKGSLETLKEGAVNKKRDADHFLDMMIKHTDRLNAIVEDLLNLSRIEQEAEGNQITFSNTTIVNVLEEAISVCQNKAASKNIQIEMECDEDIQAKINPFLLGEALINLIDNAIKYSEEESHVQMKAYKENSEVIIQVVDSGCGIPEEHQSRIFERFYRVDKGRSRDLGGTGLGLAIVKHIVQAHHGTIRVKDNTPKGSIFTIRLPLKDLDNVEYTL
ncbi:PAS domain-containing protein [bacterium]|nr:PAS domain-containing protein [bacterium]RQV93250.1 MAG: HAMP domain-containing histidine kinase [bacterium]